MKYVLVFRTLILLFVLTSLVACNQQQSEESPLLFELDKSFGSYWYQGEAELTSYELEQARYGQIHEGHAVLIFVTEPFSKSKQVKLDRPGSVSEMEQQQVMKCNFTKKFHTGIYPYSTMVSIFSPTHPRSDVHAVKETFSAQEWCGQSFYQLNKKDQRYNWMGFSYFQSEGDRNGTMPVTWLEDELWNLIRIKPGELPIGSIQMIPSLEYIRMAHEELKPYQAELKLEEVGEMMRYTIDYPELERTLTIEFQSIFPYEIESWSEQRISGFGDNRQMLTTTATKKERVTLDYWNRNQVRDSSWRKKLGLPQQP